MKMSHLKLIYGLFSLLFLILFTIAGCAGLGKQLESPPIKLANIQVKEVNVLETAFQVQLRVFNTNDTALEVKGIECELELNDEPFAMGVSNPEIKIPSYGTEIVTILVYSSVIDIVIGVRGLQKNEQLKYRLKGKLRLGGNAFPSVLPFNSEGVVSFKDLVE
jgi:LEA14-like dessication related protein